MESVGRCHKRLEELSLSLSRKLNSLRKQLNDAKHFASGGTDFCRLS